MPRSTAFLKTILTLFNRKMTSRGKITVLTKLISGKKTDSAASKFKFFIRSATNSQHKRPSFVCKNLCAFSLSNGVLFYEKTKIKMLNLSSQKFYLHFILLFQCKKNARSQLCLQRKMILPLSRNGQFSINSNPQFRQCSIFLQTLYEHVTQLVVVVSGHFSYISDQKLNGT